MKTESLETRHLADFFIRFRDNFEKNYILYLSILIFLMFYIITRLHFFLYDSSIEVSPDYLHYYTIVDQISKGFFPAFTIRTPGYPLFLAFIFMFFKSNMAVIVIQNFLSLISPLFFILTVHIIFKKIFKWSPLLVSAGMSAFISLPVQLQLDTSLATESLYINCIILCFGFLVLAIYTNKKSNWILCGFSMAIVILIRPSGLFLIAIFFLVLLFQWLNSVKKKIILLFSTAFALPLLLLSTYNHFTIGSFSLSTFTEHALVSYTSSFLEKNPAYERKINKAIGNSQKRIKRKFRKETVLHSWNPRQLKRILWKTYNRNRIIIFRTLKSFEAKSEDNLYLKWRPILKKISLDAIRKHPAIYLKYVYSNLVFYFFLKKKSNIYPMARERYRMIWDLKERYSHSFQNQAADDLRLYYKNEYIKTTDQHFLKDLFKEYWGMRKPSKMQKFRMERKKNNPGFLQKISRNFYRIHVFVFQNNLWIFFFFITLVFSLIRLLVTRFHHNGSFLVFIMSLSAFLHGVVISMSSFSDNRLSYPLDFIYYLFFFLFPIMWITEGKKSEKNGNPSELRS